MFRYFFLISLFFLGISKSYVFYLERSVISLKKQIHKQNELLNLLKVEWTYLNQNSRLQKLAQIYLKDWKAIEPVQMKNIQQLKLIMQENISKDIIKTSNSEKSDLKINLKILSEPENNNIEKQEDIFQLQENKLDADNKLSKIENNKLQDNKNNLKKQIKKINKKNKKARREN